MKKRQASHSGRLWVPIPISTGKKGQATKGTHAFVLRGTRIPKELTERLRHLRKIDEKMTREGKDLLDMERPWEEIDYTAQKILEQRREIAMQSDFYTKPITPKTRMIRGILLKAGVPVEVPIQDLKGGRELFERGNWNQIPDIVENLKPIKEKMTLILERMHAAGVSHNHLHFGNFVMNPEEE